MTEVGRWLGQVLLCMLLATAVQRELEFDKRGMVTTSEAGEVWMPLLPLPGVAMTVTLTVLTTGQMQTLALHRVEAAEMKLR